MLLAVEQTYFTIENLFKQLRTVNSHVYQDNHDSTKSSPFQKFIFLYYKSIHTISKWQNGIYSHDTLLIQRNLVDNFY